MGNLTLVLLASLNPTAVAGGADSATRYASTAPY